MNNIVSCILGRLILMKIPIKTRFCPSPTGYIHIGNVRTALFNVLLALKAAENSLLLRIEDTDKTRSYDEYTQALMNDLHWLDLSWDEGAGCSPEGEHGPYWQSQRQPIYDQYYKTLLANNQAFPCFCTEAELALQRKVQRASGRPPRYAGTCRHLTPDQIAQKRAQGIPETLRFRVPDNQTITFVDLVKGRQQFLSDDIGDFIIRRADLSAPFMYGNALDDALMGVTCVLRGEDHLTNTPRQLMILAALDLPAPTYGHISLILGEDKLPLSKRNGSQNIQQLREAGYLPIAIVNYIARLGHYYESNELMSLQALANNFELSHLSTSPARFEASQLLFWQKQAVMQLDNTAFWQWLPVSVTEQVSAADREAFIRAISANVVFPEDAIVWADCIYKGDHTYDEVGQAVLSDTTAAFFDAAIAAIEQFGLDYKALTQHIKATQQAKGKALFQPLRIALTGQLQGPELACLLRLMGKESVIKRFEKAKAFIG